METDGYTCPEQLCTIQFPDEAGPRIPGRTRQGLVCVFSGKVRSPEQMYGIFISKSHIINEIKNQKDGDFDDLF